MASCATFDSLTLASCIGTLRPTPALSSLAPPCRASSTDLSFSSSFPSPLRTSTSSFLSCRTDCTRQISRIASVAVAQTEEQPLKMIILGPPASGKGTQCQFLIEKYGLTHISTGDLLRAEVAAGTANGIKANEYMTNGQLVPDDIVVEMVRKRIFQSDVQQTGWLLDGFPRSLSQAQALEKMGIRPDVFIMLDVPDNILIERVVGRRLDPVTGKIYHLRYSPPDNDEIAARLIQRSDDTHAQAKVRFQAHNQNVEALTSVYNKAIRKVDGNKPKHEVFKDILKILADVTSSKTKTNGRRKVLEEIQCGAKKESSNSFVAYENKDNFRGIPTRLNSIPHSREIRQYFYADICEATKRAVEDGLHKLKVQLTVPELNPEMDVYRIGTLLELMRELAFTFANNGKRVKVCVQGSMGEGIFSGMPLQLAGTRRILEVMDWGQYELNGNAINIGSIGSSEVAEEDDVFLLMAPQNIVGNCIIDDLQAMVNAAGDRPLIIVNPRLKDLPSSAGVMQIRGREKRMEFAASFISSYNFRLLYVSGTQYPIMGALRMAYPSQYEIYKRVDLDSRKEKYVLLGTFNEEPKGSDIGDIFAGRVPRKQTTPSGLWGFLTGLI